MSGRRKKVEVLPGGAVVSTREGGYSEEGRSTGALEPFPHDLGLGFGHVHDRGETVRVADRIEPRISLECRKAKEAARDHIRHEREGKLPLSDEGKLTSGEVDPFRIAESRG